MQLQHNGKQELDADKTTWTGVTPSNVTTLGEEHGRLTKSAPPSSKSYDT